MFVVKYLKDNTNNIIIKEQTQQFADNKQLDST